MQRSTTSRCLLPGPMAILLALPLIPVVAAPPGAANDDAVSGREIFAREWVANDPRSHGGDGLGPVFNGSSCVTCHNQGGAGGAGGFDENVTLLSAEVPMVQVRSFSSVGEAIEHSPSEDGDASIAEDARKETFTLLAEALNPDFAESDTIVVHRFGTDERHRVWRRNIAGIAARGGAQFFAQPDFRQSILVHEQSEAGASTAQFEEIRTALTQQGPVEEVDVFDSGQTVVGVEAAATDEAFPLLVRMLAELNVLRSEARQGTSATFVIGNAVLQSSQRNTTPLWGAGLVDRIPDEAIVALAEAQAAANGRVSGRVHRLADGRLGRFGWKAQKASLYDFTMAACAVELGLHVPGEPQSTLPYDREYEPAGFDLTKREVRALVDYIAELPAPARLEPAHDEVAKQLAGGADLFATVGCATCHVPNVGEVTGLYTDFLLHDMGPDLGSVGSYGVPSTPEPDVPIAGTDDAAKPVPPTSREWRTAPLWGVRDSAPYLHDGRAKTLEQAIALHGGEAAEARLRFMLLKPVERDRMLAFLKTLVAPASVAAAE